MSNWVYSRKGSSFQCYIRWPFSSSSFQIATAHLSSLPLLTLPTKHSPLLLICVEWVHWQMLDVWRSPQQGVTECLYDRDHNFDACRDTLLTEQWSQLEGWWAGEYNPGTSITLLLPVFTMSWSWPHINRSPMLFSSVLFPRESRNLFWFGLVWFERSPDF